MGKTISLRIDCWNVICNHLIVMQKVHVKESGNKVHYITILLHIRKMLFYGSVLKKNCPEPIKKSTSYYLETLFFHCYQ